MACPLLVWSAEPSLLAGRVDRPPVIDGYLDDATWQSIAPITAFTQSRPATRAPPTQRTELRLAHDRHTLFVAIRAWDSDAGRLVARNLLRDALGIEGDDHIKLVFDPAASGRNGFTFTVNAWGAQRDGLVSDGSFSRFDYDALWDSAASIDGAGWSAEIAIPLSTFAAPGNTAWRFNAERFLARNGERMRLYGIAADKEVDSLADGGLLAGLPADDGDGTRLNLSFRPSVRLTTQQDDTAPDPARRTRLEPALDVFWQPQPGLTGVLTLNSDFADAEVDAQRVNLTRFALFLPEKRAFFTQDAGRFTFGGLDGLEPDLLPFFSRRIGVDGGGRPRNLDAGVKLAGSVDGFEFGALAAQVEKAETRLDEPTPNAPRVGVLRVARGLGEHQRVGLIATHGNPLGTRGSSLAGLDYQYRNTNLANTGKTLNAYAFAQRSINRDAALWGLADAGANASAGNAVGARIDFPNIGLIGNAAYQRIDRDFLPALGFVSETGVQRANGEIGWWHRTPSGSSGIPQLDWRLRRTLDGRERSRLLNPEVYFENASGDYVFPELYFEQDTLAQAFEVVPGVVIAPGNYRWRYAGLGVGSATSRAWSGEAFVRTGSYYNGRRNDLFVALNWRPNAHWGLGGSLDRNAIRLPGGAFTVQTSSLRLDYAANIRSTQSLLLQYDNVSRQLGASLRGKWTLAPGRELLLAMDRVRERGLSSGHHNSADVLPPDAGPNSRLLATRATIKLVWALQR